MFRPKDAEEIKQAVQKHNITHTWHPTVTFEKGEMCIDLVEVPTTETEGILIKMGNAFDLTYTRFLDLQKAEASAKEAIRQASLDRVRAEIASMRTVGDLQRITPTVWNELTIQTITFIRCGVFIMDDAAQQIHTFLSNASGQAIATFHLDYHLSAPIAEVVEHWHRRQLYASHWSLDDLATLADSVVAQGAALSRDTYLAGLPAEGIYPHFFPFPQGMLYVGSLHAQYWTFILGVKKMSRFGSLIGRSNRVNNHSANCATLPRSQATTL